MAAFYDKLVRDRIPDIIEAEGMRCETRILDDREYRTRLRAKLDEEIREHDESGSVEELIDIAETLYALAALDGVDPEKFERLRLAKRARRGRFERRLLLIEVHG